MRAAILQGWAGARGNPSAAPRSRVHLFPGEPMFFPKNLSRRSFITLAAATGAGAMAGCSKSGQPRERENGATSIEVMALQHGVIYRAVAVLEEIRGAMDARMDLPPEIIGGTVEIIRLFIMGHHQQLEEKYLYPVFDAAGKMSGLLGVLREQHAAGSLLIDIMKELYGAFSAKDLAKRRTMGSAIHLFSRMYLAHADREDTMLFTMLRRIMPPESYAELSYAIYRAQAEFLGQNGFDETIRKLTGYEDILGIEDLASYTPRAEELSSLKQQDG
jgi:hemerythrin-like domain-containing protein